ncbi:MAG: cupin domain-containing protein [Gammaproteobacteria bacterium]|nr:cupin domain-containing protein [Gammaproteobacteria bacterium]
MIDFGLTREQFRADYFEQKPYRFEGALTERPIQWTDIDQLLHVIDPKAPTIRLFQHGQLPEHAYTEEFTDLGQTRRQLNKPKFYEYLGTGATLQINWLERHLLVAKRLCLEVGRFAKAQTSGNAYMSFTGDGSFGQHWDTHDVFVLQLIGRKRWRIYEPTFPLPLTHQTHDRSGQSCPSTPAIELTLEEGDALYIPRGWWHHVIPLDTGSFHLSVGCYSPTVFDYIVQTSAKWLEQQVQARGAFSADDYRETVTELMRQLPEALLDSANTRAFELDWHGRERMNAEFTLGALDPTATPVPGDALLSLTTFRSPPLEDGLIVVNGKPLRLSATNQAVVVALRDVTSLSFDELCAQLSRFSRDELQRAVLDLGRYEIVTTQVRR